MTLWRLEYLRLRRTWRGPGLAVIFLFFGVAGPLSARYLEDLVKRFGGEGGGIVISFPAPVPADGMAQYLSNAGQLGLLAVVAVAAGALSFDATADSATFLRTRVRSTARLVLTRYAVYTAFAGAVWTAGALLAWYETWALIGLVPGGDVLLGVCLGALYYAFVVAMVALAAGITRGSVGTMFLAFTFIVTPQITLGLLPGVAPWLPGHVGSALATLAQGTQSAPDFLRSGAVTLALTCASLIAAVRLIERREV